MGSPALAGRSRVNAVAGLDGRPLNTTCIAPASAPAAAADLVPAFNGAALSFPTAAQQSPVDPDVWYVTEYQGRVRRISASTGTSTIALDLSARLLVTGEGGLLGIALHPDFASNGHIFVYYTVPGSPMRSIVSRFGTSNGGATFTAASERVILDVPQTATVHLGGDLHFGRDGNLYVGLGDGGAPQRAQDPAYLHGKVLRLDVDAANPYAIPPDNPYAAGGGRGEVFALGFRNPYRWSFDLLTGELWLGDVGLSDWEEVDLVARGGNYGWPEREGFHCRTSACGNPAFLDPELEYSHANGCAIIGGFVYRGSSLPGLSGAYVYGDYCSHQIWSALPNGSGGYQVQPVADALATFTSFAQARNGEVLVLEIGGAKQLAPKAGSPQSPMPTYLTDTGCVDPADPAKPAPGLVPYSINAALWSDGANKERWLALPTGARMSVMSDGDVVLPPGAVTMKTFSLGGQRIETRFFVRHGDGTYGGYSYEWNTAQTEAVLLAGAKQRVVGDRVWSYPSRAQCLQCHTSAARFSLGLELGQLNRETFYPATGRTAHQLSTMEEIGLFAAALPPVASRPRIERDTSDHATRGWLHANCAGCHRPGGPTGAALDLRYATPIAQTGLCNGTPAFGTLGVAGAKLLYPGSPALSVVSLRSHLVGAGQMAPLGRSLVDATGTTTLDSWIRSFASCAGPDGDGDGRVDDADNCPRAANASQADSDGDGVGNACEGPCNDRVDNDADGWVDYPLDAGCASREALRENPACDDGLDNDGDGAIDGPADVACGGAAATREDAVCADGIDNDGDGRIDFDGGRWFNGVATTPPDAECAGRPSSTSEGSGSACGLGFEVAPVLALLAALRRRRLRAREH
jgi:uncharacterized repeat protein (TIGR03806 family)